MLAKIKVAIQYTALFLCKEQIVESMRKNGFLFGEEEEVSTKQLHRFFFKKYDGDH